MFTELSSLLPKEIITASTKVSLVDHKVTVGFNTTTEFKSETDNGTTSGIRYGHWIGNRMTMLGSIMAHLIIDEGHLHGIDKELVGIEDGTFMVQAYRDKHLKYVKNKMAALHYHSVLGDHIMRQNMVTPLFNMMCIYYGLALGSDIKYDPDEAIYNNGHVKILNRQLFQAFDQEVGGGFFNHVSIDRHHRPVGNYVYTDGQGADPSLMLEEHDVILHSKHQPSSVDIAVLLDAFGTWTSKSPMMLAHSRPACLAPDQALAFSCPGELRIVPSATYTAVDVLNVICNVVNDNRLHSDFYVAYGMMASVLLGPAPRTAESAAWLCNPMTMALPRASCTVGCDPVNLLSGAPYYPLDSVTTTLHQWRNAPGVMLQHSIAMCESVNVQMAVVHKAAEDQDINFTNYVHKATGGRATNDMGLMCDNALIAMRHGRTFEFPMVTRAGLNRASNIGQYVHIPVDVTITDADAPAFYDLVAPTQFRSQTTEEVEVAKPVDETMRTTLMAAGMTADQIDQMRVNVTETRQVIREWHADVGSNATLRVRSLPPVMYPVYTYGVNPTIYIGADFNAAAEVEFKGGAHGWCRITDAQQFSRFMDVARMAGWNVHAREEYTGKTFVNFADNESGRYVYDAFGEKREVSFLIKADNITLRNKHWLAMPSIIGKVKLSYTMHDRSFAMYNGEMVVNGEVKRRPLQMRGVTTHFRHVDTKARNMAAVSQFVDFIKFAPISLDDKSDFHRAMFRIPDMSARNAPSLQHRAGLQEMVSNEDIQPSEDNPQLTTA